MGFIPPRPLQVELDSVSFRPLVPNLNELQFKWLVVGRAISTFGEFEQWLYESIQFLRLQSKFIDETAPKSSNFNDSNDESFKGRVNALFSFIKNEVSGERACKDVERCRSDMVEIASVRHRLAHGSISFTYDGSWEWPSGLTIRESRDTAAYHKKLKKQFDLDYKRGLGPFRRLLRESETTNYSWGTLIAYPERVSDLQRRIDDLVRLAGGRIRHRRLNTILKRKD